MHERRTRMNIQRINTNNNTNPVFSSKLVPNNTLRSAFDYAKTTGDVKFLRAVKNILNDGKNNEIKIESFRNLELPEKDEYVYTKLFVNDEAIDYLDNFFLPGSIAKKYESTGNRIKDSIKLIVRNFSDKKQVRAELDDIYKKLNLGEGDTRFKNELKAKGPRFF